MPEDRSISLLHLSDIHLRRKEIESGHDIDQDIRAQVLRDLEDHVLPDVGSVTGVLITGDIAFAAEPIEFQSAQAWLDKLTVRVDCPSEAVWSVPGNHDVDRGVSQSSKILQSLHSMIRQDQTSSSKLQEYVEDEEALGLLLSPLASYNLHFAEKYQCETTRSRLAWQDELPLNDGSKLVLWGLNSVLVSDASDDQRLNPMVMNLRQAQLSRDPGHVVVTLCHHPPRWHQDFDEIEDHLSSRARVSLFGHEHRQRLKIAGAGIRLFAGALHPDRGEDGWEPRYNVLRLGVEGTGADRKLRVEVFARVWKPADTAFGPDSGADGRYPRLEMLNLPAWSPPETQAPASNLQIESEEGVDGDGAPLDDTEQPEPSLPRADARRLVYQLFSLSYPVRTRLISSLDLLEDGDEELTDAELIAAVLRRAVNRKVLSELRSGITDSIEQGE